MFTRMGSAAFKKDLTNTRILCERLGNPQQQFKSIHVGGTNGKGSVSHMLAAVLQASGYKTGLYTSPHLYDFRERIKIDGIMVRETFIIDFVEKVQPLIEEIEPSFFEITVAMAFACFAEQGVDVAVIEVGLGGRLDSTNIIIPELSVITNVGWDHMNMLGNTLEEIATEKAGIIKEGIPVVVGEKRATGAVFVKTATQRQAPLLFAEDHFSSTGSTQGPAHIDITVENKKDGAYSQYTLDLPGVYQKRNLLTVLQAIQVLKAKGFILPDEKIKDALQHTRTLTGLHGRWEVIHTTPDVVLEVAHNKDGIEQMLEHLQHCDYKNLHIIFGLVKDKDASAVLTLLPKQAQYYFTQAHIPRALDAETLHEQALQQDLRGNVYEDVNKALHHAILNSGPDDLILVCGSIFLVAEVNKSLIG